MDPPDLSKRMIARHVGQHGYVCPGDGPEHPAHATPDLTLNVYARARSERLTALTEKVGKTVLSGPERALCVPQRQDAQPGEHSNSRDDNELELVEIGGGGGNRTRVP